MFLFLSARLRLTAWYLLIVAFITLCFSALIYENVSNELEQGFVRAEYRLRSQFPPGAYVVVSFEEELREAKRILLLRLLGINAIILAGAGIAGYFLATKTLQPIEAAMDDQKRFVSDASHELRTPLTTLKSEIEVALKDKKMTISEARKLLASNLEEVDKMQNLTNYLLAMSRYENNARQITKETVHLNEVAEEVIRKFDKRAEKAGINLKLITQPVIVYANATSMSELISIFLDNALKYTSKSGEVVVTIKGTKTSAIIQVKDSGIGIAAHEIDHIFDRFYRSDRARTKHGSEGYGLGLSIAQSIVNLYKGEIQVKSRLGQGTTFTIRIPKNS